MSMDMTSLEGSWIRGGVDLATLFQLTVFLRVESKFGKASKWTCHHSSDLTVTSSTKDVMVVGVSSMVSSSRTFTLLMKSVLHTQVLGILRAAKCTKAVQQWPKYLRFSTLVVTMETWMKWRSWQSSDRKDQSSLISMLTRDSKCIKMESLLMIQSIWARLMRSCSHS